MLLFIKHQAKLWFIAFDSNTSHVIVYPTTLQKRKEEKQFKYISCYCLSRCVFWTGSIFTSFKYISCYCLSAIPDMATNWDCYSNTSHVIVYPGVGSYVGTFWKFKYISCYCLSKTSKIHRPAGQIQIHLMLLFIMLAVKAQFYDVYSNTSHVIVYLYIRQAKVKAGSHSNTSHVIVYR